jgi:hypothetical protein
LENNLLAMVGYFNKKLISKVQIALLINLKNDSKKKVQSGFALNLFKIIIIVFMTVTTT